MEVRAEAGRFAAENGIAWGWSEDIGTYALAAAVNALAAEGAACVGVEGQLQFPVQGDYSRAYSQEKALHMACRKRGIKQVKTRIRRNPVIEAPMVTISAVGLACQEACLSAPGEKRVRDEDEGRQSICAGDEIVLVKWAGMEGMLRIAGEKEEELRRRFAPVFIRQIQSYRKELFAGEELEIARSAGVSAVRQIAEGGIFAALWDLSKESGQGLDVDLKRMSVLQETIEVCEQYRLNPYQLASAGSFLMVTGDGKALAGALRERRIQASVIGRLTKGNDKKIHNGGDVRYLDRPAADEIYKILL